MNTRIWFGVASLIFLLPACSRDDSATISGAVYGPQGETVPYVWIRAVDSTTREERLRVESAKDGNFEIRGLDAGTYDLEIRTGCCTYEDTESEAIVIEASQTLNFDVHVEASKSLSTLGDDGSLGPALRAEAVIPDEPPPRTREGRPDLSGVWLEGIEPFPEEPKALPWAQELAEQRRAGVDTPHHRCLPGTPPTPRNAPPFLAKFVQADDLIVILFEDYPGFRQVYLDGRQHPEYPNPSWVGHSIGHWEDDTLVIDTIGYNDRGWLRGRYPRSEELRIVERYSRPEYGRMDVETTFEDPNVFEKPFKRIQSYFLLPHVELLEFVCEHNKWVDVTAN